MKIGVVGCAGRMGQMLVRQIAATRGCAVAGGCDRPGSAAIGKDLGTLAGIDPVGVAAVDDPAPVFAAADAVIDFSTPAAALRSAALAAQNGTALVVGTTGLEPVHIEALREAGRAVPVVQAANMSLCVNLLLGLVKQVAQTLGPDYDIEILEMHHRHKVDAPSGTALALGRAAAAGRGVALDDAADRGRDGITGPRQAGRIGFAVLRGGDVVGDHTVIFAGDGERIELTHKAAGRHIYATGAVRAALWTKDRPAGLYGMDAVLGL